MISIVVCHHNPALFNQLKGSILNTIGANYEIISIDNTLNKYNIFQAYNLGIDQSKYDIICFVHEDIIFHTKDWGKKVVEHFKNPKVGIIGVAGSHYMPKMPGAHWSSGITSYNVIHTIGEESHLDSWRYSGINELSEQAVLLDGLWLCISKDVLKNIRFDDVTFSGFHCYDSDICLQIKRSQYEVRIVFDILIEHFSFGKRDKAWLDDIFNFYNKWKRVLPMQTVSLTRTEISQSHFLNAKELFEQIQINNSGLRKTIKTWIFYLRCNPPVTKSNLAFVIRLISEKYFGLLLRFKKNLSLPY